MLRMVSVMMSVTTLGILASLCTAQSVHEGFEFQTAALAPAGSFVGGFDVLPNGNWVLFDGADVVEFDPATGHNVRTIFSPPGFVFGAFVELDPSRSLIYFGESSSGAVHEIDVVSGASRVVVNVAFPFDLAFDPAGRAFLQWSAGFGLGSQIDLLDLGTGALDPIFTTAEASGPVLFDEVGQLFTVRPDTSAFPPPADTSVLLRFSASQVEGAVGPGHLVEADGQVLALLDGGFDLACDASGDLFVSDSNLGTVTEWDGETGVEQVLFTSSNAVGYLRHVGGHFQGHAGTFERYQPESSAALFVSETDFFSLNDFHQINPRRAVLTAVPGPVVPVGPFEVSITQAVPSGMGLMLVGVGVDSGPALTLPNRSWPAPLFLELDLSGGLRLQPFTTDAGGARTLLAVNPGVGGVTLGLQAVVGSVSSAALFATSSPLALHFD